MTYDLETLYALLPAAIRARDVAGGEPLKGLLAVVGEQVGVLEENLAQSYDDLFVETCADWVVPYIGDLVGTTPLFDSSRVVTDDCALGALVYAGLIGPRFVMIETLRSRADVARTLSYRRRKATRPMLEELARDVTGWPAHVVEMFQRLRWTQCIRNHVRPQAFGPPDLRNVEELDRMNGPFDVTMHGVDVRAPSQTEGWYQVPNIAFFLWRLKSFALYDVPAPPLAGPGDWRYHFSPLGNPAPLFAQWDTARTGPSPQEESRLPAPIRAKALARDLRDYLVTLPPRAGFTAYYGRFGDQAPAASSTPGETLPDAPYAAFTIVRDGKTVPPDKIRCIPLETWCQPKGDVVGVDPIRGRMAFGTTFVPATSVDVYFHHGFSAGIGGGSYPRGPWLVKRDPNAARTTYVVASRDPQPGSFASLALALAQWAADGMPHAVVSIADSRTYVETIDLAMPAAGSLIFEAAAGARPHVKLTAPMTLGGARDAAVTLSGLLVEGAVHVTGQLGFLRLLHTTLVPGGSLTASGAPATTDASLVVTGTDGAGVINDGLDVAIASSITGPLRIPADVKSLWIADSIVDGVGTAAIAAATGTPAFGPPTTIARSTVFGATVVRELTHASETIFADLVTVSRRQIGCVRFSFVPTGSTAPRRYRCQPDLEIATRLEARQKELGAPVPAAERDAIRAAVTAWLAPTFTSRHYGDPGYAQLAVGCPSQITRGAQNGSEMGVWAQLEQPQREQNLLTRLREYLPLGLRGFLVYAT